tara:strand:+ start:955 stop:1125 length:171 start_codon:yes stop_codon:yes gene_type:complete
MDKKAKEIYDNQQPKLTRRNRRKAMRQIDKDIKAGKYNDLIAELKKAKEDKEDTRD